VIAQSAIYSVPPRGVFMCRQSFASPAKNSECTPERISFAGIFVVDARHDNPLLEPYFSLGHSSLCSASSAQLLDCAACRSNYRPASLHFAQAGFLTNKCRSSSNRPGSSLNMASKISLAVNDFVSICASSAALRFQPLSSSDCSSSLMR
jgi:hypothetical protein